MNYETLLQFFSPEVRELILSKDISDVMFVDADEEVKVFVDRGGEPELCDGRNDGPRRAGDGNPERRARAALGYRRQTALS
jgi:hypothetical protein